MMTVFNINYEPDRDKVLQVIDDRCGTGQPGYVCVADGNILAMVHRDEEYRNVINGSIFSIVDSSWVPLYVRKIYGYKWEQYSGSRIFADLTEKKRYRMFFLGSRQNVLDALKRELCKVDPAIEGMEFMELPFCNVEDFDYEGISDIVNRDNPDLIWLSLGAPKQERFAARLVPYLKRGVVIPVGAVFNFRSGIGVRRAPQWMVKCHLEFIYRIFREPGKQLTRCANIITTLPRILRNAK